MQSFEDFLKSRRNKPSQKEESQVLKRSRSAAQSGSTHNQQHSLFDRSFSSRGSPGNGPGSPSPSFAAAFDLAAPPSATHTTTTVLSGSPPGSRYLSRTTTNASSQRKLSEGLASTLQHLISPQSSLATLQQPASTNRNLQRAGVSDTAAATAATPSPPFAAAAEHLVKCNTSSRSIGLCSSTSLSRLQPLSVQEALASPLTRSTTTTPPGARTPTGSRRYPAAGGAAAAAVATTGTGPGDWLAAEVSATAVLQEAAARAAALSRSTTLCSQHRRGDPVRTANQPAAQQQQQQGAPREHEWAGSQHQHLQHDSPSRQPAISQAQGDVQQWQRQQQLQQVQQEALRCPQQWPQQQQQQPQQHGGVQQQGTQQHNMQQPQQEAGLQPADLLHQRQQQEQQQQVAGAAALLHDLDQRFASIKDSFNDLLSPSGPGQHRQTAGRAPTKTAGVATQQTCMGTSAAADLTCSTAGRPAHCQQAVGKGVQGPAVAVHSTRSSLCSSAPSSPQGRGGREPQQQQLLSPTDSSSTSSSSNSEGNSESPRLRQSTWQQQHGSSRHMCGNLASGPHQQQAAIAMHQPREVTLTGGLVASDAAMLLPQQQQQQSMQQQQKASRPVAASGTAENQGRSAAAAAAVATAAGAADGSLPLEDDVQCGGDGDGGTRLAATARFVLARNPPEATAGVVSHNKGPAVQHIHQQHEVTQQQVKQQQHLSREVSLPSSCSLLSSELTGAAAGFPGLSASPSSAALGSTLLSQPSSSSFGCAGAPQPRSLKPQPSIAQQQQPGSRRAQAAPAATGPKGRASHHRVCEGAGGDAGRAAAAVAAAGLGVLDHEQDQRWTHNALVLAKQQAAELQQQNDALVRVLERERQEHAKTRQRVSELKLDLEEAQADWQVKLQGLRQEQAAARAQLRRALEGDQEELLDAFDAALAASAARTEVAQTAAARLASQLVELELQVQQLQLICSAATVTGDGNSAAAGRQPFGSSSRDDNAAVVRAVASAEGRSPEKPRSPCRNAFAGGAAPDGCGGRGVRALRHHQAHLEQQLAKQAGELEQLQRDNVKLMRYKKQYEVAAQSLQASTGVKAAAEAFAQEAGLRAAAAAGRADRLEVQVEELQLQVQQLKAERDRLQLHWQITQQQQQLRSRLVADSSSVGQVPAAAADCWALPAASGSAAALSGVASGSSWHSAEGSFGPGAAGAGSAPLAAAPPGAAAGAAGLLGASLPAAAAGAAPDSQPGQVRQSAGRSTGPANASSSAKSSGCAADLPAAMQVPPMQVAATLSMPLQQVPPLTPIRTAPAANTGVSGLGVIRCSITSSPGAPATTPAAAAAAGYAAPVSAAEHAAMSVVQQLQTALPLASPVHNQLATLMSAIQAGVEERQALTAQGQVLLGMLVGSS